MKLLYSIVILAVLFFANIKAKRWIPTQDLTWNYILGGNINENSENAKVVDIDINKSKKMIRRLQKKGIKVICYFSCGTLEPYRDDYDQFKAVKNLVRNTYISWPDEKWLDFRIEGIKPLLRERIKLAKEKNCDAIEVDNLDGYQMKEVKTWKNPLTRSDTIEFAKWISKVAHEYDLSIGLKNVPDLVDELSSYYDFAINEECVKYNECHHYKNFLKSGKAVFGVTYFGLENNRNALCKNLNGLGINMIIKKDKKLHQESLLFNGKKACQTDFKSAVSNCFSIPLGYPCCVKTKKVEKTDEYGTWGKEGNSWCGLSPASDSNKQTSSKTKVKVVTKTKTKSSNGNKNKNNKSCFSKSLGFPCCSSWNTEVVYKDSKGTWGVENGNWCGISSKSDNCFSVDLGFPCCSEGAKVYYTDKYGKWGVEYGDWCGIPKKKKKSKIVTKKVVKQYINH